MIRLTQIVRPSMHNNRPSHHTIRSKQLNVLVLHTTLSITLPISLKIAQIAYMTLVVGGRAVGLGIGVKVGPGAGAAVGVVAELVDVHTPLGGGVVAADVVGNGGGGGFVGLFEGDRAADFGVAAEDCHCC